MKLGTAYQYKCFKNVGQIIGLGISATSARFFHSIFGVPLHSCCHQLDWRFPIVPWTVVFDACSIKSLKEHQKCFWHFSSQLNIPQWIAAVGLRLSCRLRRKNVSISGCCSLVRVKWSMTLTADCGLVVIGHYGEQGSWAWGQSFRFTGESTFKPSPIVRSSGQ